MTDDEKEEFVTKVCKACLLADVAKGSQRFIILQERFFEPLVKRLMGKTFQIRIDKRLQVPAMWRCTSNLPKI